jgi:hypothetical protein
VLFTWHNTSNPSDEHELTKIRKILFSDEGGVNSEVRMSFAPEFNLTSSGGIVPIGGNLLGGNSPVENKVFDFEKKEENENEDDWWNGGIEVDTGSLG